MFNTEGVVKSDVKEIWFNLYFFPEKDMTKVQVIFNSHMPSSQRMPSKPSNGGALLKYPTFVINNLPDADVAKWASLKIKITFDATMKYLYILFYHQPLQTIEAQSIKMRVGLIECESVDRNLKPIYVQVDGRGQMIAWRPDVASSSQENPTQNGWTLFAIQDDAQKLFKGVFVSEMHGQSGIFFGYMSLVGAVDNFCFLFRQTSGEFIDHCVKPGAVAMTWPLAAADIIKTVVTPSCCVPVCWPSLQC